ncbi:AAA family ATPase [Oceanobacillus halotolerans]|uniref:AAA family ATPase n=1 Tax=Oceanobacillus halotolerans TaxID=2663380 RepID=UPI0013DBCDF0|nr:P-loop NTPase [Oceanobacillus halotolerans]
MSKKQAKLIAVCSAVGGTGRTTITVNLATAFAKRGLKVGIVDGDLQFGDIAMALDVQPSLTLKEISERSDVDNIRLYYTNHPSGIQLLAAPTRPEFADIIDNAIFQAGIEATKEYMDITIVETQAGLQEKALEVMEKADEILLVTTPAMHVLKNTKLMIETIEALGMKEKITVVVNKAGGSSVMKRSKLVDILGVDRLVVLPADSKHVNESLDLGQPLVVTHPKHIFTKEMESVATTLTGEKTSRQKKFYLFQPKRLVGDNQ